MDKLPDELVLYILSLVDPEDVVRIRQVSRRFCSLGRDDTLWKINCFLSSRYETLRRLRQAWETQESRLAELRRAINQSTSPFAAPDPVERRSDPLLHPLQRESPRQRALANWEPGYPSEYVDFYQEYVHRHAPVSGRYFEPVYDSSPGCGLEHECLGVGILRDGEHGDAHRTVAPLDDGSICVWDISSSSPKRGKVITRTAPNILQSETSNSNKRLSTIHLSAETGAVDNVSIDSGRNKAYIANQFVLTEIDLVTLKVVHREPFPFPITALSATASNTPLTIGTNMTLHLYDVRNNKPQPPLGLSTKCELIAGTPMVQDYSTLVDVPKDHFSLSQPGPLSILHLPAAPSSPEPSHSIWVAGRFTSLLHYDRRYWPQIHSTIFSGARISSLCTIPYPFVHPELRKPNSSPSASRAAKLGSDMTLLSAGEYKGKGSLELYSVSPLLSTQPSLQSPSPMPSPLTERAYRNRQSAASSRLLSVAPHGARIVFSDGNGNLKWVERDGSTLVRSFNIDDVLQPARPASRRGSTSSSGTTSDSEDPPPEAAQQGARIERINPRRTLFADPPDDGQSDIVQKIIPLQFASSHSQAPADSESDDLLIWTGDGKLAMIGFGKDRPFRSFGAGDSRAESRVSGNLGSGSIADDGVREERDRERERERERLYADRMREALERQADETRWVRGLGLGG